jgi:hypothetical protein
MVELKSPWRPVAAVEPEAFAAIRRRAIFECCKWDPQVEDVSALALFPLVLRREPWDEIARLAAALAAAAEEELLGRPDLHRRLGLPRAVRRVLAGARRPGPCRGIARVMRFDFHWTRDGWRAAAPRLAVRARAESSHVVSLRRGCGSRCMRSPPESRSGLTILVKPTA